MIIDKSGIPSVGLSLLRANLEKLTPPRGVELKFRGEKQVLVVTGVKDTYESESFGWGDYSSSERVRALSQALELVGAPTSFEYLRRLGAYPSQGYRLV